MRKNSVRISVVAAITAVITGCGRDQTLVKDATAAEPRLETLVVPLDTSVVATLDHRLTTETNRSGDPFTLTTIEPITVDGRTAIPAGAVITGTLTDVQASGRTAGRARMTLSYRKLTTADGTTYAVTAEALSLRAGSATGPNSARQAGGGAPRGPDGGIAGGGKDVVIRAGADAVVIPATRGDGAAIDAGQKVNVMFTSPLKVQVAARN